LRPLSTVTRKVENMHENNDYTARLELNRSDELGMLASAFDNIMHQIEGQTNQLKQIASLDELTGLANRRSLLAHLDVECRRMARKKAPLSLIMCDVDRFKLYNDTYGHAAGDECLKSVAEILSANTRRAGDLSARYGGEEFVVVLPGTSLAEAKRTAEKIRTGIEKLHIKHKALKPAGHLTLSLGVATSVPDPVCSIDALLKKADEAMYEAKKKGRNCVAVATGS